MDVHNQYKGWTPVAWNTVTSQRIDGGLGVRNVETQNKADFTHLAWRFLNSPNTLWSRILRQKYLCHRDLHDVEVGSQDSNLWQRILRQRATILDHQRWVVGNGIKIMALDDDWVPTFGPLRAHLKPGMG